MGEASGSTFTKGWVFASSVVVDHAHNIWVLAGLSDTAKRALEAVAKDIRDGIEARPVQNREEHQTPVSEPQDEIEYDGMHLGSDFVVH